jgi:hypothetical protein
MPRIHRILIVCLLSWSLGFQWFCLQSVAWASMLVQRTVQSDWHEAFRTTFDGQHPCQLCRVVQSVQSAEDDSAGPLHVPQLELMSVWETTPSVASRPQTVPVFGDPAEFPQRGTRPPIPPPRSA